MFQRSRAVHRLTTTKLLRKGSSSLVRAPPKTRHGLPIVRAVPLVPGGIMVLACHHRYHHNHHPSRSSCEASILAPPQLSMARMAARKVMPTTLRQKVVKALRMFARVVKLAVALTPLLLLFPLLKVKDEGKDAHEISLQASGEEMSWFTRKYLEMCLRSVEWSGAAVIKLMQWLSSRPDLVGHQFCSIFSRLQDETTPHAWKHTEKVLREAYGEDWQTKLRISELIGSGCIGQVYKGYVQSTTEDQGEIPVAIKILHPAIDQELETDLDLMRLLAHALPHISKPLSWLNPQGAVEEFGRMLTSQLDLRHEARNLQRFNREFEKDEKVIFPKLIPEYEPTRHVLVETFVEGVPVLEFAKQNAKNKDLLAKLCVTGIETVCKMIFWNNHCHGDLHPGNVLISPDHKVILLDVGITNEYTDVDHQLIVDVLTSFIRYDGRSAGRLMMENSNLGVNEAVEGDQFVDKIEKIGKRASSADYLMENLGTYITEICDAAATHHVLMNQAFVSAALAIKVQEGIVLTLCPSMKIYKIANPIILEGEARRRARNFFSGGDEKRRGNKPWMWQRLMGGKDSQVSA